MNLNCLYAGPWTLYTNGASICHHIWVIMPMKANLLVYVLTLVLVKQYFNSSQEYPKSYMMLHSAQMSDVTIKQQNRFSWLQKILMR